QGERFAEVRRERLGAPRESSALRPSSPVWPKLSPFHPTLSPERRAPFCAGRVVVQRLNLAFDTSKPAHKESASRGRKVSSYQRSIGSCCVGRTKRSTSRCQTKLSAA